jgi:hypothetical protein
LLEDGAGIVVLSLEVQSLVSADDAQYHDLLASEEEEDDAVWDFMTGCLLIEPFHQAVKAASQHTGRDTASLVRHAFEKWAGTNLAWLPRQACPPAHNSICGYRVAMTEDASPENADQGPERSFAYKKVTIFNFTPAHVDNATKRRSEDMSSISGSSLTSLSSLRASPSWSNDSLNIDLDPLGPIEFNAVERFAVLRSVPLVTSWRLAKALEHYVAELPYIVASRKIRLSPPDGLSVAHLTQDYLSFAQVCASDFEVANI